MSVHIVFCFHVTKTRSINICLLFLFVFVALHPKSTAMVMAGQ